MQKTWRVNLLASDFSQLPLICVKCATCVNVFARILVQVPSFFWEPPREDHRGVRQGRFRLLPRRAVGFGDLFWHDFGLPSIAHPVGEISPWVGNRAGSRFSWSLDCFGPALHKRDWA
jgi:hypothetical protein